MAKISTHHPQHDTLIGIGLALLAAIGFSAKAILVKLAYLDNVDAITLLALRMTFAAPFFLGVALWSWLRHAQPLEPHDRWLVLGLGLVGYYLASFLDFLGLQYISAGLERLILFLYPTITVILSAFLYKHAIGRNAIAAMALCYLGIALVFVHDVGIKEEGMALGSALVFSSTLLYSIYLVGAGHAIARIGAVRFTAYASLVASIACILQFVLIRPLSALVQSLHVYECAIAIAIFSTALPVFMLSFAIRRIGSGNASLLGTIGPISTIYMAYLFLGEQISLLQISGSALVLVGILVIGLNTKKPT